jgi:hypothetical protein
MRDPGAAEFRARQKTSPPLYEPLYDLACERHSIFLTLPKPLKKGGDATTSKKDFYLIITTYKTLID